MFSNASRYGAGIDGENRIASETSTLLDTVTIAADALTVPSDVSKATPFADQSIACTGVESVTGTPLAYSASNCP